MGAGEVVLEEVCKGNNCVEESKHNAGCLSGILDPKAPTSHKKRNGQGTMEESGCNKMVPNHTF